MVTDSPRVPKGAGLRPAPLPWSGRPSGTAGGPLAMCGLNGHRADARGTHRGPGSTVAEHATRPGAAEAVPCRVFFQVRA
jgi:hypothetical protein